MRHRNILPLIGFWKEFSPSYGAMSLSLITPWIDDGDLLLYLKSHSDVSTKQRLKFVSLNSVLSECHADNEIS